MPLLLKVRDIAWDPSENSCMRDIDSTLSHHFYQVSQAELVGDVSTDAEDNDDTSKATTVEESR